MAADNEIAHGVIGIETRDEGALASLRRVEREFDHTMANIDRQEAEVRITADKDEFDREIKRAKQDLGRLKKERANPAVGLDTSHLDRQIAQVQRDIAVMEREKATVRVDADISDFQRGMREAEALEAKRAKAEDNYHNARMRALQQEARRRASLSDQRMREFRAAEAEAHRADRTRDSEVGQVLRLQREYAKLTDRVEALSKRHAFTREARAKLDLDTRSAFTQMLITKAELNRLGAHPPVDVRVDMKRSDISRVKRAGMSLMDTLRSVAQKASGLSDMTLRLGPFTASVRQAAVALAFLSPIITDLIGGATALAGVLGTALAGSAATAGGVVAGLGINFLGMRAALNPAINDFKIAKQTTDAYHKAVLKYGAGSDKAQKAQAEMNSALKGMDPLARKAAVSAGSLGKNWQKIVGPTAHRDFNRGIIEGVKTLNALMPTLGRNTNRTMDIVSGFATKAFQGLRSAGGKDILGSLGRSANEFLKPALDGVLHLGAAFGHVAEAAARLFAGQAGQGFERWAKGIDDATQKGPKLDDTLRRLGDHAKDVGHLFMDFGRLMATVFNGGANAGDNLVNQLDHAFRSWNAFLKTDQGQKSMSDFFRRSADSVSSLAGALAPIAGALGDWSNLLSPFTRGILDVIGFVSRVGLGLTKVIGLGGPLTALGATMASIFALTKISGFIAAISRLVSMIAKVRREEGNLSAVASLRDGRAMGAIRNTGGGLAAQLLAAEEQGAAALRAAILEGSTAGAARYEAALATGGRVGAAERAATMTPRGVVLPAGAAAQEASALRAGIQEGAAAGSQELRAGVVEGATVGAGELRAAVAEGGAAGGLGGALGGGFKASGMVERLAASGSKLGRAAGGVLGFGEALTGIPAPLFAVGAAIGVVVGAEKLMNATTTTMNEKLSGVVKNADAIRSRGDMGMAANNKRYMEARDSLGDFGSSLAHANISVRDARKALDGAKKGTQAYRDALLNLHDAQRQQIQSRKAFFEDRDAMERNAQNQVKNADAAVKANNKIVSAAKRGMLEEELAGRKGSIAWKMWRNELDGATKKGAQLSEEQTAAWNRVAALPMQAARGIRGFAALTGEAEQAVGRLARTAGGKEIATKVSVKYDDPKKAGRVASAARSALQSGVGRGAVMKIIADSRNADAAIRRLQNVRLSPKTLRILEEGGKKTIRTLEDILGRKLTPKEQKIAERGGNGVTAMLTRILATKLPGKVLPLTERGSGQVLRQLFNIRGYNLGTAIKDIITNGYGSALSALHSIMSITDLGTAIKNVVTHHSGASGGVVAAPSGLDQTIIRGAKRAEKRAPQPTHGGMYRRPTLLVGEEDRTEYVIATNPAYRTANRAYLRAAASDLGMVAVDAARKGKHRKHPKHGTLGLVSTGSRIGPVDFDDLQGVADRAKQQRDDEDRRVKQNDADRKKAAKERAHARKHNKHASRGHKMKVPHMPKHRSHARLRRLRREAAAKDRVLRRAMREHQTFENRDVDISTLSTAMQTADAFTGDRNHAANTAEYNGKWFTFGELKSKRQAKLDKQLAELRGALNEVQADSKRMDPSSRAAITASKWVYALRQAIGQTLSDRLSNQQSRTTEQQDADSAAQQRATDQGEYAAVYGVPMKDARGRALTAAQRRGLGQGYETQFEGLDRDISVAALRRDDPTTPQDEGADARARAATAMQTFWQGVYDRLTAENAPATRIKNAADQLLQAREASSSATGATAAGSDMSVYSTARADLLSQYGSNTAGVPAPVWSSMGDSSVSAAGGGSYVSGGASTMAAAAPVKNVTVNNSFPTPPPDPHTWSQGVAFELQTAV